ncbi:MAG: branched-chain amino acid ABC transporter permease [Fibrobacteres bacterium]|nr:branched-chain amino acid ABC transporter permease [Fibrobacterota bacterium]
MNSRLSLFLTLLISGVVIQIAVSSLGVNYYLTQLTMSAYYGLIVLGLAMLMGYAGQISLGHAAFFAMGGYISAYLTTLDLTPYAATFPYRIITALHLAVPSVDIYGKELLRISPIAAMPVAVAVTALTAAVIGIPVLRLKGHYLAMATLGFGTIIYRVLLGTAALGAADGLSDVPPFPLPFGLSVSGSTSLRVPNFYFAWILLCLGLLILLNLLESRSGRALKSIHDNEDGASACGVDAAKSKQSVFILSAVFAAIAGVMLTHFNAGIGPSEASVMKSVRYVALVAAGGMSGLFATSILALVLNFLSLRGVFGTYDDAVFGVILLVIMLFAPDGIPAKVKQLISSRKGKG